MKHAFLWMAVLALLMVATSCQKPEEVTITKYFQAMGANDRDTMAAMAVDPVKISFKSYKVVLVGEPVIGELELAGMLKTTEELKKKRVDLSNGEVADKAGALADLETKLGKAGGKAKADLQKQVDAAAEEKKAAENKVRQVTAELNALKAKIENERNLIKLSSNIAENQEAFAGKSITSRIDVKVTSDTGEKDYVFQLRKYEMLNPSTNKPMPSARYVIVKIQTKEDFESAK